MKIILENINDVQDGVVIRVYRLLKGLQQSGAEAEILVQFKESHDYSVISPETK